MMGLNACSKMFTTKQSAPYQEDKGWRWAYGTTGMTLFNTIVAPSTTELSLVRLPNRQHRRWRVRRPFRERHQFSPRWLQCCPVRWQRPFHQEYHLHDDLLVLGNEGQRRSHLCRQLLTDSNGRFVQYGAMMVTEREETDRVPLFSVIFLYLLPVVSSLTEVPSIDPGYRGRGSCVLARTCLRAALVCGLSAGGLRGGEPPGKPVSPREVVRLFNGHDFAGLSTWLKDTKHEDPRRVSSDHRRPAPHHRRRLRLHRHRQGVPRLPPDRGVQVGQEDRRRQVRPQLRHPPARDRPGRRRRRQPGCRRSSASSPRVASAT